VPGQRWTVLQQEAKEAGVTVLADDFSLRERGIEAGDLRAGVRPASIDTLVDLIVRPDAKTVWH
jgi:predicted peroxiredoxin